MIRLLFRAVWFACVVLLTSALLPARTGEPRTSPFEMVRWNGDVPEVQVRGAWWRFDAIDGVTRDDLLAFARKEHGDQWAKRFCEDLVELLTQFGRAPAADVELELTDLATGSARRLEHVALSADQRRRIRDAAPRPVSLTAPAPSAPARRVERARASAVSAELEPLVRRLIVLEAQSPRLTRAQAAEDLAELEWLVANTFSYRERAGFDSRAAFDALHARLGDSISLSSFALQIHGLLARFGDGHTRVQLPAARLFVQGALPVRLVRDAHGVAALDARAQLVDERHPYLVAIDGVPLATWFDAAAELVPRGSPALVARGVLRRAVHVAQLRAQLGRAANASARLTLADRAGTEVVRDVELAAEPLREPEPPLLESRTLADGVGYLRIGRMDDDAAFLARLDDALDALQGARGVVIDVRGNGGGSRLPLLHVWPRLAPREVGVRVVNIAALRVAPGEDPAAAGSALADRYLHAADWSGWSDRARTELAAFVPRFRPAWTGPASEFTPWHYLVLERDAARAPLTDGKIIVLLDEGCFSATDVFVAALAELPNVTLAGTTSGGGSGRARGHVLAHSRLPVQLSTMLSCQPSGALYDGNGVNPAVSVPRTLDDYLGRTDTQLARAVELASSR